MNDVLKFAHARMKPGVDVVVELADTSEATCASMFSSLGTRTSKRPSPATFSRVRSTVVASASPSSAVEMSMRTCVFVPSVRMMLLTFVSALVEPEALAPPETTTPPVAPTAIFSTVSAFAEGGAPQNASRTEMRSSLFMSKSKSGK